MGNATHAVHPTGLALSLTAGIIYVVCAAAIALWPTLTLQVMGSWFHGIDIQRIATTAPLTWGNVLSGLVGLIVAAYLVGALFAWLYNRCLEHCQRKGWM